jgi:hypothetical protein
MCDQAGLVAHFNMYWAGLVDRPSTGSNGSISRFEVL